MTSKDGSQQVTDERINTVTSITGAMLSVLLGGAVIARIAGGDLRWYQITVLAIYIAGFINLFVMSALHHGLSLSKKAEEVLRTLDYTAIFWHIAATTSAIIVFRFESLIGLSILAATWLLAALGITLRSTIPNLPRHIANTLFISLGWIPAVVLILQGGLLPAREMWLLLLGGACFSIGFVIYVSERPNPYKGVFGFHEIWHILVIAGSIFHWLLIRSYLG